MALVSSVRSGRILLIVGKSGSGKSYKANELTKGKRRCIFDIDRGFQHLREDGDTFSDSQDPDQTVKDLKEAIAGNFDVIIFDGWSEFYNALCSKRAMIREGKAYIDPGQYTLINRELSTMLILAKSSGKTLIVCQQEKDKKNREGNVIGWDYDGSQQPLRMADKAIRIVRRPNGLRTEEVLKVRDVKGEAAKEDSKESE